MAESEELCRLSSQRLLLIQYLPTLWYLQSDYHIRTLPYCDCSGKSVVFIIHTGGGSSADWSVRRNGTQQSSSCGGSMPPPVGSNTADPHGMLRPSSGIVSGSRSLRSVLENRDLCRIVSSYIPTASIINGNAYNFTHTYIHLHSPLKPYVYSTYINR